MYRLTLLRRLLSKFLTVETFFLLAGLSAGVPLCYFTGPLQSPDEGAHFARAYQVSTGSIIGYRSLDTPGATGGSLPRGMHQFIKELWEMNIRYRPENRFTDENMAALRTIRPQTDEQVFTAFPSTANRSPFPYLPQALGIGLARLFGAGPLTIMYTARVANVLAWLLLTVLAIRCIPTGKWVLAVVALMPMSLFMAATTSPDAANNACGFLFIAMTVRYALQESRLDARQLALLTASAAAFVFCKFGYLPLTAIVLILPLRNIGTVKRYIAFLAFFGAAIALVTLPQLWWTRILYYSDTTAQPAQQLAFIFERPGCFLSATWAHLFCADAYYWEMFIGILGWIDTLLPRWLFVSYSLILFISPFIGAPQGPSFRAWQRLILVGVFSGVVFAFYFMFYLTYTPLKASAVEGVQGRYFIVCAPLFLLALQNTLLRVKRLQRVARAALACFLVTSCVLTAHTVWKRYFAPLPLLTGDLLPNGGFDRWPDSRAFPEGILAPSATPSWRIVRLPSPQGQGFVVAQTWDRAPSTDSLGQEFMLTTKGVKANTPYLVRVRARNLSDRDVGIAALQVSIIPGRDTSVAITLDDSIITVPAHAEWRTYQSVVFTDITTPKALVLAVKPMSGEGAYPGTVEWDEFCLYEVAP